MKQLVGSHSTTFPILHVSSFYSSKAPNQILDILNILNLGGYFWCTNPIENQTIAQGYQNWRFSLQSGIDLIYKSYHSLVKYYIKHISKNWAFLSSQFKKKYVLVYCICSFTCCCFFLLFVSKQRHNHQIVSYNCTFVFWNKQYNQSIIQCTFYQTILDNNWILKIY